MFGHNERLARKLKAQGGKRAWATVLESEQEWASSGGMNREPGQAGSFTIHQRLKLRIGPDDEPSFEATVKQVFNDARGWPIPQEGDSVMVIYDPGDHSKLVLDMEAMPVAPGPDRHRAVARATAPAPDAVDRLTKLADLRDRGALTDAEFDAQKAKILGAD